MKVMLQEYFQVNHYEVCIHEVKEATIYDSGSSKPQHVRSVRILVEYINRTDKPLKYRLGQWWLYDMEGYVYDSQLRNQFYEEDAARKLREGMINAGKKVRGWVAFQIHEDSQPDYVQFRTGHLSDGAVDVQLGGEGNKTMPASSWWQNLLGQGESNVKPLPSLIPEKTYRIKKPFIDFYETSFIPDRSLTFIKQYPPYQGLVILHFAETLVCLHAQQNADLLQKIEQYIVPMDKK